MRRAIVTIVLLTSPFLVSSLSAQDRTRACLDAAAALVSGSQPRVASDGRFGGSDLAWQSANGHQGVCRFDGAGRLYQIEVTRFPSDDAGGGQPYLVTCESRDYRRAECRLRSSNPRVQVRRQLSTGDGRCIRNRTFGVERSILWVDGGCRAVFEVTPTGSGGGGGDSEAAMSACVRALEREGLQVVRHTSTRGDQRYLDLTFTVRRGWMATSATCRYDARFGSASILTP